MIWVCCNQQEIIARMYSINAFVLRLVIACICLDFIRAL